MSFNNINLEGYVSSFNVQVPIIGISDEVISLVYKEVQWHVLNNLKPKNALIPFLLFQNYEWPQFDKEQSEALTICDDSTEQNLLPLKVPTKPDNLQDIKKRFYNLSFEARKTLAEYDAIGRVRRFRSDKTEKSFVECETYDELLKNNCVGRDKKGKIIISFETSSSDYIKYEMSKIALLLSHTISLILQEKNHQELSERLSSPSKNDLYVLIDGFGGSYKCKSSATSLSHLSRDMLPPHGIGCKCCVNVIKNLMDASLKKKYGI
ncbi:hypothetical protein ABD86_17580 [Paenibacillus alvei]|nr:hypothetical protein [Paenibacillus alvei]MBG9733785.1 hypothetical protein [Paenibacillus alvei]MBG9745672.1 hypothetical protein [Paenibacillus alvei]MCY9583164.1 hypothetical protein [Paenibacillus alvei]